MRQGGIAVLCAALAACASAPRAPMAPPRPQAVIAAPQVPRDVAQCTSPYAPAQEDASKRGDYVAGGLYRPGERDRVPGAIPDISCIPEPQVVALAPSKLGNRPVYSVLDREYRVLGDTRGFVEEGLASYYGEKFHGRRTSNWEVYDMYAFSAAHKTLPLPSFARVTSLDSGRSVVVRVNDRGPFHDGRVMDLSLAAAVKLGIYPRGTGRVRVEALQPGDDAGVIASAPVRTDPRAFAERASSNPASLAGAPATVTPMAAALTASTRYDLQPGANAAGFDGWMQQRGVRIATGRPMPVVNPAAAAGSGTMDDAMSAPTATFATRSSSAASPLPSALPRAGASDAAYALAVDTPIAIPQPLPLPQPKLQPQPQLQQKPSSPQLLPAPPAFMLAAARPAASTEIQARTSAPPPLPSRSNEADAVVLQVASFATRDNAERARGRLQQAGIDGAQVLDAMVDGKPVWRLRVGPLPARSEAGIIARLAGLGFASPRRARD